MVLKPYPPDRRLCVITVLNEYVKRTKHHRGQESRLLISYCKPYRRVSRETVSRWIKIGLVRAGIDVMQYTAHSTRMAATSRAFGSAVGVNTILQATGWSSAGTFKKFYCRSVDKSFAEGVLQT